jgi:hypothetical protein
VSPSWRERLTLTLAPGRITLERGRRGRHPAQRDVLECEPADNVPAWRTPVDALREWLSHQKPLKAAADVVLSNHFVRYLLLPWNASIAGSREEGTFASARFQQVYGEIARTWVVRVSPDKPGAPRLAAAVDRDLLDAIAGLFAEPPLRLRSIQPALMAACNVRFAGMSANAWVALAEPGHLLLGLQQRGQWRSLRSRPLNGEPVPLAGLIEQERLMLGIEPSEEKIYLHQWGDLPMDAAGVAVERWSDASGEARAA